LARDRPFQFDHVCTTKLWLTELHKRLDKQQGRKKAKEEGGRRREGEHMDFLPQEAVSEAELATWLIRGLRVILPIILFLIYRSWQLPKEEQYPGPTEHVYDRARLLARRPLSLEGDAAEKPSALSSLCLKDQQEAPNLFQAPVRQLRGAPRRDDRRDDRRDRRNERREARSRALDDAVPATEEVERSEGPTVGIGTSISSAMEERMYAESLLNYVAFNRKEQQRIFLPDKAGIPPPPPPKARPLTQDVAHVMGADSGHTLGNGKPTMPEDVVQKANADAQLVLRGALNLKCANVAKDIHEQLTETKVKISESTFMLMVEVCVLAHDLKSASDFLMKMETSGYCPESHLLDKVMELYSQQKAEREQEKLKIAEAKMKQEAAEANTADGDIAAALDELLDAQPRVKLSSGAPIFVPGVPGEPAAAAEAATAAPTHQQEKEGPAPSKSPVPTLQRTRLTTTAKPFEPQFGCGFAYGTWAPGAEQHRWPAKAS